MVQRWEPGSGYYHPLFVLTAALRFHHKSRCCEGLLEDHALKKVYIHLFMNHISRTVNQWREVLKNSNQSTFTLEHRAEHKLQICQIEGGEECNSCSGPKYHSTSRKKERVKVATFNLRSNLKRKDLFPSNLDILPPLKIVVSWKKKSISRLIKISDLIWSAKQPF